MAIWNKQSTLKKAIEDWVGRDVISADTGALLHSDVEQNYKAYSFSWIVTLLGVICLAFGFITFVAANWDGMSSSAKVITLLASMWSAWLLSITMKMRQTEWLANLFVLLACCIFGASIMLISQIYHLQGEPKDAVIVWAFGTFLAAILTRSIPALALSILLLSIWMFLYKGTFFRISDTTNYLYLLYWSFGALATIWLKSRFCAHLLMLGLIGWALFESLGSFVGDDKTAFRYYCIFAGFVFIACLLFLSHLKDWLKGFEPTAIVYLLICISCLLLMWYTSSGKSYSGAWRIIAPTFWPGIIGSFLCIAVAIMAYVRNAQNLYDIVVTACFALFVSALSFSNTRVPFVMEALLLGVQIWSIRMGWRLQYKPMSIVGFLGFAIVMLVIYFKTVGTLLDTSLFYFGAGLVLVVSAIIIPKLMKKSEVVS